MKTLLLHGALADYTQLVPLSNTLGADFIALNLPGHGEFSISNLNDILIPQLTEFVENYILENQLSQVNIVGYSLGGYIALNLAHKNPSLVNKIITLGTIIHWDNEVFARESKMLNPAFLHEKVPAFVQMLSTKHKTHWKTILHQTYELLDDIKNNQYLSPQCLKQICNQVLLIVGDKDSSAGVEATQHASIHLSKAQIVILENTPHVFEKVNQDVLANHIYSFINND